MAAKKANPAPQVHANVEPGNPNDLLDDLREIYKNLDAIDTRPMNPEQQQQWFSQYTTTRQAIMVVETNALAAINQQLGALADNVRRAIDDCEKALHGVQEAAVIIKTVAVALGAIAQIAMLFA